MIHRDGPDAVGDPCKRPPIPGDPEAESAGACRYGGGETMKCKAGPGGHQGREWDRDSRSR